MKKSFDKNNIKIRPVHSVRIPYDPTIDKDVITRGFYYYIMPGTRVYVGTNIFGTWVRVQQK